MAKLLPPIPPGKILQEEFMEPMAMNMSQLAKALDVPANRVHAIIHGKRAVSADTALRLARLFGTTAKFWLNLQTLYDLEMVEREKSKQINKTIFPLHNLRLTHKNA